MSLTLSRPRELADNDLDWTGRWRGKAVWDVLNAARDGDVPRLRTMLNADPTLVQAEYWYTPPLHFATREGHLAAVRLLVETGADIFHRSYYGQETLLQIALDRGHTAVADALRGELQRRAASDGAKHPIHDAAASDMAAVERLLADDSELVNRGDALGRRPLHYAVEAGHVDMVDLLIHKGAAVDATGFSSDDRLGGTGFRPLTLALWHHPYWRQRNDYAIARRLLTHGAAYTITIAAALGDEDRVRQLLRADAALANYRESGGKRPLSAAAERGHAGIVAELLDAGANPNLEEGPNCPRGYALWAASHFGHVEIAERLLAAGADPNAYVESSGTPTGSAKDAAMRHLMLLHGGRTPLSQHFYEGNIDVVAALLAEAPALFDAHATAEGFTMAVVRGHETLVRLMLAHGLRVPAMVTNCQTYLWRTLPLARLLLEHGMAPNLPNWQQVTPLHHMATDGNVAAARLFLEFGADPNAIDEEYRSTPLGWGGALWPNGFRALRPRVRVRSGLAHGAGLGCAIGLGAATRPRAGRSTVGTAETQWLRNAASSRLAIKGWVNSASSALSEFTIKMIACLLLLSARTLRRKCCPSRSRRR